MTCDLCTAPAVVHLTDAKPDAKTSRHLCLLHAVEAGFLPPHDPSVALADILSKLQGLLDFMKTHNRNPTAVELAHLGGAGSLPQIDPTDPHFHQRLSFLESFIAFAHQHGRLPTTAEMPPDPFGA